MKHSTGRPIVSSILILAVGITFLVMSLTIPHSMLPSDPGPGFLPGIAGAGLTLCGIVNLFSRDERAESMSWGTLVRILGLLAALLVYVNVVTPLGFIIATPLFLAVVLVLFGNRSVLVIVLYAVILTAVTYLVFRYGLKVALPRVEIGGLRI